MYISRVILAVTFTMPKLAKYATVEQAVHMITSPAGVLLEVGSSLPDRTYWHSDTIALSDRYSSWKEERRIQVPEPEGELISSLCTNGLHAPTLDIDMEAELESLAFDGLSVLSVDQGVRRRPYTKLLGTMARLGLIPEGHDRTLVSEIGQRTITPFIVGLDVPARLLSSSTSGHHHLYLDVEMPWEEYTELLKGLEEATLIQRGFYRAGIGRQQTMLRKPGVHKS